MLKIILMTSIVFLLTKASSSSQSTRRSKFHKIVKLFKICLKEFTGFDQIWETNVFFWQAQLTSPLLCCAYISTNKTVTTLYKTHSFKEEHWRAAIYFTTHKFNLQTNTVYDLTGVLSTMAGAPITRVPLLGRSPSPTACC